MTYLFVGNSKSPLAINRFKMVDSLSGLECFFFDKSNLVVLNNKFQIVSYLPCGVSKLFTIAYINKIYHIVSLVFLCHFCFSKKVSVVHFHGVSSQLLCLIGLFFKTIKIIATPQGSDINQSFKGINKFLTRHLLNSAAIVTVKSNFMRYRVSHIANPGQIVNLNWGVDSAFDECVFNKSGNEKITIISPRTNRPNYNIDIVFSAVKRLKKSGKPVFFIYVSLEDNSTFDIGVDVADEIHYAVNYIELAGILARSDIMISMPTNDGFSTSIMEALSLGVYPVISDIEAYKDEFLNDNNLLSKVKINVDDLTAELNRLCSDIRSLREGRKERRSYAQNEFSRSAQIKIISNILSVVGAA